MILVLKGTTVVPLQRALATHAPAPLYIRTLPAPVWYPLVTRRNAFVNRATQVHCVIGKVHEYFMPRFAKFFQYIFSL